MELTEEEFDVLWQFEEGASFINEFELFTGQSEKKIKKTLEKLEKAGIIKIEKKYDSHYKHEVWDSKIINKEKAKGLHKKYSQWIP